MEDEEYFPRGSRWLEAQTNRVIVIDGPGPSSPWWHYEDDPKREQSYCCWEDFFIWKRFTRVA